MQVELFEIGERCRIAWSAPTSRRRRGGGGNRTDNDCAGVGAFWIFLNFSEVSVAMASGEMAACRGTRGWGWRMDRL